MARQTSKELGTVQGCLNRLGALAALPVIIAACEPTTADSSQLAIASSPKVQRTFPITEGWYRGIVDYPDMVPSTKIPCAIWTDHREDGSWARRRVSSGWERTESKTKLSVYAWSECSEGCDEHTHSYEFEWSERLSSLVFDDPHSDKKVTFSYEHGRIVRADIKGHGPDGDYRSVIKYKRDAQGRLTRALKDKEVEWLYCYPNDDSVVFAEPRSSGFFVRKLVFDKAGRLAKEFETQDQAESCPTHFQDSRPTVFEYDEKGRWVRRSGGKGNEIEPLYDCSDFE